MTTTLLASFPSPSQGVWHLGPLPIRAYAFFIIAGIVVALIIGERRWQQRGGEPGTVYDMVFWAVGFGLIGGRLYHVITDWDKYFIDNGPGILGALRIWDGGLGIWGAVALGGVGAWIGCRRRGIPLPAFGDAIAPGIILAQAIGRLGNYFNQELYGRPTTLPWGLEIYERSDASGAVSPHLVNGVSTGQLDSIVHPTFLYELLWNLLVFAALMYIDRRFKIGHGRLFAMYVAGYCFGRFWIELMRVDEANGFAGIRINSFTSTFVFIGAVIYIMAAPKGREDPATLKGTPTEAEDKAKDTEEEEETSIEEFVKELTGVAATTTGLVAAAKVAGEAEDEDATAAAGEETEGESETHSEAAAEAEALTEDVAEAPSEDIAEAEEFADAKAEAEEAEAAEEEAEEADEPEELGADVAGVPADDIAEAEEFAAEGEEEPEGEVEAHSEAAAEAEALVEDVAEAPSEDIAEAEEFAEAKAEAVEADSVGGVGAVEGEEAVEAEEAAPEVHDAAVGAAEETEDVAAEVTNAAADDEQQADAELGDAESVGGVGAVEGEEAVEAEEAAPEVHDAAVGAAEEAEGVAAEVTDAVADDEQQPEFDGPIEAADEAEAVEAQAAVEEAEGEPSEEEAAEVAEAVVAEAEAIEEQEPEAQVLADEDEPESTEESEPVSDEPENEPAEESGGRLRRWLRGRRSR